MMSQKDPTQAIVDRLRRVEGQLRGITKMITEDRDCETVVVQMSAARAALEEAARKYVGLHLQSCLGRAGANATDMSEIERAIELLTRIG
ncbi:MAG: metal-sensitive transcriptional regulator [Armatimonadetes bacterium]|nr:metal-sensitive transcriptional regulator [Armatimonadota bacterium]